MILEVLVLLAQRLASTTDQNLEHRGAVVAAPPLAAAAAMSVCAAAALASEKADAVAGDVAAAVADEPAAAGMSPIHSRWNAKSSTAAWDVLADPVPESSVLLATSVPVCRTARCPPPHTASHLAQPASREAEALVPDAQHAPAVGREAEISLATAFV